MAIQRDKAAVQTHHSSGRGSVVAENPRMTRFPREVQQGLHSLGRTSRPGPLGSTPWLGPSSWLLLVRPPLPALQQSVRLGSFSRLYSWEGKQEVVKNMPKPPHLAGHEANEQAPQRSPGHSSPRPALHRPLLARGGHLPLEAGV